MKIAACNSFPRLVLIPSLLLLCTAIITLLLLLNATSTFTISSYLPSSLTTTYTFSSLAFDQPKTYLPYTFGYPSLLQTLHAYHQAGWKNIVVLDNSWDHHAYSDRNRLFSELDPLVVDVIKTPVRLKFAQLQGFIDTLAREEGAEVYMWGHTDTILLGNDTRPYDMMEECLNWAKREGDIGVLFTSYDLLSAVFVNASAKAPWDPGMPQYGADCDRYARIRLAGYRATDCPYSIGEMVHSHTVLSSAEMDTLWNGRLNLEEQLEMLREINENAEQYAWRGAGEGEAGEAEGDRYDGFGPVDEAISTAEGEGGRSYFEAKWGPFDCELDGRTPKFDIPNAES
ncbi:hypothetical protein IAT40_000898 [Kwoniella sp. CBS 6097]